MPLPIAFIETAAAVTVLLGHAVVVSGHEQLGIPLQPHQRKLPQCHIKPPVGAVIEHQRLPEALGNKGRDLRQAPAVAGRCGWAVRHLGIQHDGIYRLHHSNRQICPHTAGDIQLVKRCVGGEDLGVPLTAEQDAALVKDAQPLQPRSGASIEFNFLLENSRISLTYFLVEMLSGSQLALMRFIILMTLIFGT